MAVMLPELHRRVVVDQSYGCVLAGLSTPLRHCSLLRRWYRHIGSHRNCTREGIGVFDGRHPPLTRSAGLRGHRHRDNGHRARRIFQHRHAPFVRSPLGRRRA